MSQRVSKTDNGKRPGYRGDAAYNSYSSSSTGSNRGTASKSDLGGGAASGPSGNNDRNDRNFTVSLNQNPTVSQSLKDSKAPTVSAATRKKEKDKVIDYNKAQTIASYQPNKYLDYVPYLGTIRKTVGTPFTKTGKILSAKKRMEYINSLPAQQRRAMIERLGLAEDEEYDELDEYNLATQTYTDPKTGKVTGPAGVFNTEDVDPNFGRYDNVGTDYTLTGDPLSYQGETPLYSMGAYDIINYDGEYLRQNKRDTTNKGSGSDQTILPYPYNVQQPEEEIPEDTGPDYRFGTGQGIGADVTRGYYSKGGKAEGGIMELRARRAFGGIMDRVTGRKAYGLGSIFKSVKKAAGKVLSSDIGKAAIIGAGIYYGGGGGNPFTKTGRDAFSFFGNTSGGGFFSKDNPLLFSANDAGKQKFNPLKFAGLTTLGGALMGPAKQDSLEGFSNRGGHLIDPITGKEALPAEMRASLNNALDNADGDPIRIKQINDAYAFLGPDERLGTYSPYRTYGVKDGGRIGKAEGGLMDLGGMEKDYRAEGGFVPIGEYEKKDDVPARLSVNEFVFTADAVRGAGQGDIDKGAEIMENMMKNLEKGGTISEESQGNIGAQQMFETSERLGEVI